MNWKKYLCVIALFMSYLVITIPIFSSYASAAVQVTGVNGEDGVNGYVKTYDYINVSAWVTDISNVTPAMVLIQNDATFSSCAPNPMRGYTCNYITPYMEIPETASGPFDVSVKNDGNAKGNIYVDSKDPNVSITSAITNYNKNITFDYKFSHSGHCPGITKAEFSVSGQVLNSTNPKIASSPTGCAEQTQTAAFAYSDTGNKTICVRVYDALGHNSEYCQMAYIDMTSPAVTEVQIVRSPDVCKQGYILSGDKNKCESAAGQVACPPGEELNITAGKCQYNAAETELDYVSANPENVWVRAVIDEHKWGASPDIKADLSDLIDVPAYKETLKSKNFDSTFSRPEDGIFVWQIMLSVFSGGERKIILSGKDAAGNAFKEEKTVTLNYDTAAPKIVSVKSEKCRDRCIDSNCSNVCYVGPGWNKAVIDVAEMESGLDFANIFLDLGVFNDRFIGNKARVAECVPGWTCNAPFEFTSSGRYQTGESLPIAVIVPSQDDAGNIIKGSAGATLVLDKDAPSAEAKNISIKAVADLGEVDFYQSGDELHIVANVYDYTPVSAVADFSGIMGAAADDGNCEYDELTQKSVCEWNVGPIINGYKKATVKFNFTDFVGNTRRVSKEIEILATGTESSSLWHIAGLNKIASLNVVDRRTAMVMPEYPVYFSIPLVGEVGPNNIGGSKILSLSVRNCISNISTGEDAKYYLTDMDPQLINNYAYGLNIEPGSSGEGGGNVPSVALKYLISTSQPMPRASIVMNCKMQIVSRYQGVVTPPEEENVSLEIRFYDSTFGPIEDAVMNRIYEKTKWIKSDAWNLIDIPKKIFAIAQTLCRIVMNAAKIWAVFSTLFHAAGVALGGTADALKAGTITAGAGAAAETTSVALCATGGVGAKVGQNVIYEYGKWFCYISSCRIMELIPGIGDYYRNIEKLFSNTFFQYAALSSSLGGKGASPEVMAEASQKGILGAQTPVLEQLQENSIIWSAATLCLPGMIKGIDRLRQVECKHLVCLQQIPNTGNPAYVCDQILDYDLCKFVYGEIFNAFPITLFIKKFLNLVKDALKDPVAAIGIVGSVLCTLNCPGPTANYKTAALLCDGLDMTMIIWDVVSDVQAMAEEGTKMFGTEDYCDQAMSWDKFTSGLGLGNETDTG